MKRISLGYKRTSLKVKCLDGTTWITRTVYERDGVHYIKADGVYRDIFMTDRGFLKTYWYNDVKYIEE